MGGSMVGQLKALKSGLKFGLGAFALLAVLSGCLTNDTSNPNTPTAPTITSNPQSVTVNVGGTTTFSVTATGSGTLTYQWQKNMADIAGATSASYTTPAIVALDNNARFRCIVTNTVGTATSTDAVLTLGLSAPTISTPPLNVTVNENGTATFTVVAAGGGTLTYQWRVNGTAVTNGGGISGATLATLIITNVQANEGGNIFTCVVTNSAGSVTSAGGVLSVNVPVTTKALNAGAQDNFNSFLDIDIMMDFTIGEVNAPPRIDGDIDLFFGFGSLGAAIYSPDVAKSGIGGNPGFDSAQKLSPARVTPIRTVSVNFGSITNKAQIDSLWASATPVTNGRLPIAIGDTFLAQSNLGLVVLIQVSALVVANPGGLSTVTLTGKTKF